MNNKRIIPTPAPSDNPTFTVLIDGKELSRTYHIQSIVVMEMVNKIANAKIILLDGDPSAEDFPASNEELFVPGKTVEILLGYHSNEKSVYKGIIIKHSIKARKTRASTLIIECRHQAVKMTVGRKNAYYYETKDSDVFNTLLDDHGVTGDIDDTSVVHKELVQYNCTDWDFLVSRAEANGMLVLTDGEKLAVKKPDFSSEPKLSLLYGATILEFEAEIDARQQFTAVSGQSWDSASQALLISEGEEPTVSKHGNVDASALAEVLGVKTCTLNHTGIFSEEELKAWADACFLKSRMARIRGRAKCIGFADIHSGSLLALHGVGKRFNGNAFVSGVRHEAGNDGWTTDIQFGVSPVWFTQEHDINPEPAAGLLPAVNGLQIGVVSQLEGDPDGEDRILVKMPIVDNNEDGIWARVAALDAGKDRGAVFRPEIGDEVVLGFLNDDPRNPIVLGMLNSSSKPAPITAKDDNHEKGFVSRSQMKLTFNDDKKSITLETPAGKAITISEDQAAIVIGDENKNKIVMNADGITLESGAALTLKAQGDIKIEGTNIAHKANAQFTAEGSAGAELKTSAVAVIKGSLVQIN